MRDLIFERIVKLGMGDLDSIKAAVLVDRDGVVFGIVGDLLEREAAPIVALVMRRLENRVFADRLQIGELLTISGENELVVSVANRQLFLIAVTRDTRSETVEQVRVLRDHAIKVLADRPLKEEPVVIWNPGGDGSGQGPANLPLIEYTFDAVRPRAKA